MHILKMGYNAIHDNNFRIFRPNGYPHYLLLLIKSPSIITINDIVYDTLPGTVIIYDKNQPHVYQANQEQYINDWLHFDTDNETDFFTSSQIPLNTPINIGHWSYLSDFIRLMSYEYYSSTTKNSDIINLMLNTLLLKLGNILETQSFNRQQHVHYSELIQLRNDIYSNPHRSWQVAMMAQQVNLCPTYLQKLYKQTFGISCMADVITSRIHYAQDILSKTTLPINDVARACGYENDVHFMRQFKKQTGMTPSNYRANHSPSYDR